MTYYRSSDRHHCLLAAYHCDVVVDYDFDDGVAIAVMAKLFAVRTVAVVAKDVAFVVAVWLFVDRNLML